MTQVVYNGPGAIFPGRLANLNSTSGLLTLATLDAAGETVDMFGRYWWPDRSDTSKNLTHIHVNIGAVASFNAASQWRVSVQGFNGAAGPPARGDGTIAASFTSAAGVGPTATAMNRVALAAPLAVTFGAKAVIRVDYAAFTAATSIVVRGLATAATMLRGLQQGASENTTGSYVEAAFQPIAILEFDDGTFGTLYGFTPVTAINTRTWSNTGSGSGGLTNGNQRGLEFTPQITFNADIIGVDVDPDGDFEILLLEGTTLLETITVDANEVATAGIRRSGFPLTQVRTFTAGTTYRVLIRPTTTTNVSLISVTVGSNAHRVLIAAGWTSNSRTDSGAMGTAVDTELPLIWFEFSGADDGSGSGGGGLIVVEE